MTEQEIEKLREKLGSDYSVKRQNGAITVELVDIWKGVEFARCVESRKGGISGREIFEGQVYRITGWFNKYVMLISGFEIGWEPKGIFTPASEDEYVDQLKKEAKERFGEIKDGDRFDLSMLGGYVEVSVGNSKKSFTYQELDDKLYFGDIPIYQQGKWAKKVKQPIRVEFVSSSQGPTGNKTVAWFQFELTQHEGIHTAGTYLAECLQAYLNKQ